MLGAHEGAVFYTIGQRHGLYLSGVAGEVNTGLPYYVAAKDLARNIVYVSRDLNHPALWTEELELEDVVWRGDENKSQLSERENEDRRAKNPVGRGADNKSEDFREIKKGNESKLGREVLVRVRHRGELIPARCDGEKVYFEHKIRRPASGQSAVFYDGKFCLGGGIIR